MSSNLIIEGQYVMIKNDNRIFSVKVERNRPTWMDKNKFKVDNLIGQKFGSSFTVKNKHLELIVKNSNETTENLVISKDNRNLIDDATNQKLSRDEIMSLKHKGIVGDGLVDIIVKNSATFESKTEFSQQKYINKKKKKHNAVFTVIKPTPRLVHEMYYHRGPLKIINLRADTMAQILNSSNIRSGSRIILAETCYGILLGALVHRMRGNGNIVNLYNGSGAISPAMDNLNFSEEEMDIVLQYPYNEIANAKQVKKDAVDEKLNKDELPKDTTVKELELDGERNDINKESDTDSTKVNDVVLGETDQKDKIEILQNIGEKRKFIPDPKRIEKQALRIKRTLKAKQMLQERSMDSLIVATKYHPTSLVLSLIGYVAESRPIVVYCQNKEPLVECYNALKQTGKVALLNLSENWLREYQVLPSRTHPTMMMSATGGYVLTGTTLL